MTIVPDDGIVAISDANSEDDLLPLQRALPPSTEESMALALEPPPLPNSMLLSLTTLTTVVSLLSMLYALCRLGCVFFLNKCNTLHRVSSSLKQNISSMLKKYEFNRFVM